MKKLIFLTLIIMAAGTDSLLRAQGSATVRGYVYDKDNGEPVLFTNVYLEGSNYGAVTDANGFYSIPGVKPGSYVLMATGVGYDTARVEITLRNGQKLSQQLLIGKSSLRLETVNVSSERLERESEILISTVKADARDIKKIPSMGGEADLAQYLQIIPGVVTTGDQGGQIYIRGGAPVHNKVVLDGMTLYNAFHSIGLFSVFETEAIRNVEVLTGGFNAEYGGRVSAVVDVTTRDGNKKEFAGIVSANPFITKVLLEGPIKKLSDNGSSISYLLTGKTSYLKESSKVLYKYADQFPDENNEVLPYTFNDIFGKISFNAANGSQFSIKAFNFGDNVQYQGVADYKWNSTGLGAKFTVVPGASETLISGNIDYSDYRINLSEADEKPRFSSINGFNMGMDFTYFLPKDGMVKYGVDINGFSTKFEFFNRLGIKLDQNQNTTEIGGYVLYRKKFEKLIIEPSFRIQYYASLNNVSPEPRLGIKYNALDWLRFKFAGGFYSQNLISTKSDRDVVNLFTGYLSGPEEQLKNANGESATHKLQKAYHLIAGVEVDLSNRITLNVEPYYKKFTQLINLNRNKVFIRDPNYMVETGNAYGLDFLLRYESKEWFIWMAYSLGHVTRFDGVQVYPPHYDRRHNLNFVASYQFGHDRSWEISARWNLGSGFPFTLTQAFYEELDFSDGISTDYLTQNGLLGIVYDENLNAGRLPYYHRLDLSLKKTIHINTKNRLQLLASITNVYNRNNIFYFDRVRYERVNQLPILPAIGFNFTF